VARGEKKQSPVSELQCPVTAIQTLQRVGRGKAGGEWVWQLVWGKYLEETQGGHGLAGVFSGGKTIGSPASVELKYVGRKMGKNHKKTGGAT
jgi:hypothetical protein